MASRSSDSPFPAYGSRVGPWIVGKLIGNGSYGRVFQAVHEGRPEAGSYALKVACRAADERFERESYLLSRIHHPSVPRFEESGIWTSPEGEDYRYLVMEWVEGLSPYSWALEYGLTVRQAISQLAQIARALQATHQHGVHRDVKGGNVRVSPEGKAVLLDFGSCWYPQASPLTGSAMPPGTDEYRSPQQWMYEFALKRGWADTYDNTSADDLYALGVTAYRLLAGAYPPRPPDTEDGAQKPVRQKAPRGLEQVSPELSELIERLLAEDPQERGSAKEVAEELEALREYSRPALDEPWVSNASRQPTAKAEPPVPQERALPPAPPKAAPPPAPSQPAPPQPRGESVWNDLGTLYGLAGGIVLGGLGVLLTLAIAPKPVVFAEPESESQAAEQPDAGTSLGDEGMASVSPTETIPHSKEKVSREIPDKPSKDQKRPPCTQRAAIEINGGCWRLAREGVDKAPCDSDLFEHGGRCYYPILTTTAERIPTSDEPR